MAVTSLEAMKLNYKGLMAMTPMHVLYNRSYFVHSILLKGQNKAKVDKLLSCHSDTICFISFAKIKSTEKNERKIDWLSKVFGLMRVHCLTFMTSRLIQKFQIPFLKPFSEDFNTFVLCWACSHCGLPGNFSKQ
jgi:hypothetical protein